VHHEVLPVSRDLAAHAFLFKDLAAHVVFCSPRLLSRDLAARIFLLEGSLVLGRRPCKVVTTKSAVGNRLQVEGIA
jgi:hypothetical protein